LRFYSSVKDLEISVFFLLESEGTQAQNLVLLLAKLSLKNQQVTSLKPSLVKQRINPSKIIATAVTRRIKRNGRLLATSPPESQQLTTLKPSAPFQIRTTYDSHALTSVATLHLHNQSLTTALPVRRPAAHAGTQTCRTTRNCSYGPGWIRIGFRQTTDNQLCHKLPQKPM